jgi:hypothetical protein
MLWTKVCREIFCILRSFRLARLAKVYHKDKGLLLQMDEEATNNVLDSSAYTSHFFRSS